MASSCSLVVSARHSLALILLVATVASPLAPSDALAANEPTSTSQPSTKPWCAPEVSELSDHVCYFDGGASSRGRRTLVIYLHGSLVFSPGFQYVQQRNMRLQAKQNGFAVLIPTSPRTDAGFWWPSSATQKADEPGIVSGIGKARAELEARLGTHFDETFVVGFSSGGYYASSLAVRGALDVDGYIVLAGGSSWTRPNAAAGTKQIPIYVGVSASDPQTRDHSRGFTRTLAALHWPFRVEEREVGHLVDPVFVARGLAWLRGRAELPRGAEATPSN
jgi:poly(3-hydroxybutyrate) depolymerase